MNWQTFFGSVPDFRKNRRRKHHLVDILVIALYGLISGADDFEENECYGKRKETFLRMFVELPDGIPSHDTFERVFKLMDKKAFAIHFIDDPISGARFLWVRGPALDEVLFEIVRRLPAYDQEELLAMAAEAKNRDEAVDALFKIGVGFPNFDSRALRVFEVYLTHPTPLLREATVQAVAYRLWPEGMKLLEKVAQEDPDKGVREFARDILAQMLRR